MRAITLIALALLGGCAAGDGVSGSGTGTDPEGENSGTYALVAIDGAAFDARATLVFGPGDAVGGQGPCNRWSAALLSALPEFRVGNIVATEMACDDLAAEAVFFAALREMVRADVTPAGIVMTGAEWQSMLFVLRD